MRRQGAHIQRLEYAEAAGFFSAAPAIARKLARCRAGRLAGGSPVGRPASGGRRSVILPRTSKRDTGRTLYILDEPLTGLHFHDIQMLPHVPHRLRDAGNTVLVIGTTDVVKPPTG